MAGEIINEELNTGVLPIINVDIYGFDSSGGFDNYITDNETMKKCDEIIMNIAPEMIEETIKEVLPSAKLTPTKIYHPREYNFSGDELEFNLEVSDDEFNKLKEEAIANEEFGKFLKDNYSSHSGFISKLPDNVDDFKEEIEWKQLVQVIMFALRNSNLDELQRDYDDKFMEKVGEEFEYVDSAVEYILENINNGEVAKDKDSITAYVKELYGNTDNYDYILDTVLEDLNLTESKKVKTESKIYMITNTSGSIIEYNDVDDLKSLADAVVCGIENYGDLSVDEIAEYLRGEDREVTTERQGQSYIMTDGDSFYYISYLNEADMESLLDELLDLLAQYVGEDEILEVIADNEQGLEVKEESRKVEVKETGKTYPKYKFTKEDRDYIQNLVGDNIEVKLDTERGTIDLELKLTGFMKYGIVYFKDELYEKIQEYLSQQNPEYELRTNNTGTTLWVNSFNTSKKEEAKFKDKVKAIKQRLKKDDKRLSDKTAEDQAKKIAGSMIKNEGKIVRKTNEDLEGNATTYDIEVLENLIDVTDGIWDTMVAGESNFLNSNWKDEIADICDQIKEIYDGALRNLKDEE